MSSPDQNSSEEGRIIYTAVAIDRDKNSQFAVKWAIEKLKLKDNRIILVHVKNQQNYDRRRGISFGFVAEDILKDGREPTLAGMQQLFIPYRSFCARKGVICIHIYLHIFVCIRCNYIRAKEVILHNLDVASALVEYISLNSITTIILGASSRSALTRVFKNEDVPTSVAKYAPDSCSVYAISKAKIMKLKSGSQPATPDTSRPAKSFGPNDLNFMIFTISDHSQGSWKSAASELSSLDGSKTTSPLQSANTSYESLAYASNFSSPYNSGPSDGEFGQTTPPNKQHPGSNSKISTLQQSMNNLNIRVQTKESPVHSMSGSSDLSGVQSFPSDVSFEILDRTRISDSSRSSASSQAAEMEDELRRLKQELKQMTEMYNGACKEAVRDIVQWKSEGGSKLEEAKNGQENALATLEREKQKCKAAVEVAHKAQRIAELESEKRKHAEMKFKQEAEEKHKAMNALANSEIKYRKYTISEIETVTNYFSGSEKIGEGGYGPVFKAILDHTPVAIKVLRPDISQGQTQFQREVEVLSQMRHPHMVILLGACPEYGCLVYEFMDNGSLEDRLYCRNGTQPLPWSTRFRIAAEIATALNFLHSTKPEPLVHRDLKPANILLDKNYVSKISDVGLSRLVPPSSADTITQYRMTAAAGTFCYIDPEYQQTGMLGTKSDIYSLGVMLLQIITAKPAMGLTYHVENAIECGKFGEILDQTVKDWPVEDALSLAKLGLKCCELRRRDRPDLDLMILPELERLRDLGSQTKPEDGFCYMYTQSQSFLETSSSSQVSSEVRVK
ncbi:hypothetical protein BUALT_Bualt07G0160400 [Buddleja alternifolia]|uniref:RING-type E3 ubiquitin transferase n=1 Tax=Buddleja alternifolia TaxID=168488 RepID=A0AAV6XC57_9LAMI|nr:hypothetical protein BUALT_Bualt07G0160400 [Buddleja alternifolia]